jgi:hypothetical protein
MLPAASVTVISSARNSSGPVPHSAFPLRYGRDSGNGAGGEPCTDGVDGARGGGPGVGCDWPDVGAPPGLGPGNGVGVA